MLIGLINQPYFNVHPRLRLISLVLSSRSPLTSRLRYCDEPAIDSNKIDTKLCTAGYFCDYGSTSATQENCGKGFYCPQGTERREPCPEGTILSLSDSPIEYPCELLVFITCVLQSYNFIMHNYCFTGNH